MWDGIRKHHMVLVDKFKGLTTKKKILLLSAVALVIAAIVWVCFHFFGKGYLATTMRLLRVEGTVSIEDSKGKEKPVMNNIRFSSGDALNTGSDGLASVGLDDTKIVTLEHDSRAEFVKRKKQLELKLTKGALYFEVTEHLNDDETFEIKTSTMTVGIRGTSGYVYYDEDGRASLVLTDGKVTVVATNPETGETKTTDVKGGQSIKVYIYSADRPEGSIDFYLDDLDESEIPEFPLRLLADNDELLDKICDDTGWDKDEIRKLITEILDEEEKKKSEETPTPDPTPGDTPTPVPPESSEDPSDPSDTPTPTNTPTPVPPAPTNTPTPEPSESDPSDPTNTPTPVPPTPTNTPTPVPPPPTNTPTPVPPTPTNTPTPVPPTPTNTPPPTNTPTPTPTNTPTPTPTNTPTPTPTPKPIPDREVDVPSGFAEEIEWIEEERVFIIYGNDEHGNEKYLGWVEGKWVELRREEKYNIDLGYNQEYFYYKNSKGKEILYYIR